MKRRDFITKAGVGVAAGVAGAATLSAPAIADGHKELNIVSTWPRDFPGLGLSAQNTNVLKKNIQEFQANKRQN